MQRGVRNHYQTRGSGAGSGAGAGAAGNKYGRSAEEAEVFLHWGNRKRLRCVKFQRRDADAAAAGGRRRTDAPAGIGARGDRRAVRAEGEVATMGANPNANGGVGTTNTNQRLLRNSETMATTTKANIASKALPSPERVDDKAGDRTSSGCDATVWPKFAIALTNKEKEEDFLIFKGSKLPQRPKKRTKLIQKTVNLVCPGTWLCDLTLERYEVREKKTTRKQPRGLKAMGSMGSMESDSE